MSDELSEIPAELRNIGAERIKRWEEIGVDAIEADLTHTGGIRHVGSQDVQSMAWRWVRWKKAEQSREPSAPESVKLRDVAILKPAFFGFGIDLQKAWAWLKEWRRTRELASRTMARRHIEDQVTQEVASQRSWSPGPGESQAQMNRLAGADLNISEALLGKAIAELEMRLDTEECALLATAQKAWKVYAKREAEQRAGHCRQGSMHPGIYRGELERLTHSRIADLREQMKWRDSFY